MNTLQSQINDAKLWSAFPATEAQASLIFRICLRSAATIHEAH